MKTYRSFSSEQTKDLGRHFAKNILAPQGSRVRVLLLRGELGSGKTTFAQGFLRGLGFRGKVTSPTFILMRKFRLPASKGFSVFHIDAYRLKSAKDLLALGLRDILDDPRSVVLLEWPERAPRIFGKHALRIRFRHGRRDNERIIMLSP